MLHGPAARRTGRRDYRAAPTQRGPRRDVRAATVVSVERYVRSTSARGRNVRAATVASASRGSDVRDSTEARCPRLTMTSASSE